MCTWYVTSVISSFFVTPWIIAHQAPLSMEFSREEYWRGLPWPPQGIFPTQGLNPSKSLKSPALANEFFTTSNACEASNIYWQRRYLKILRKKKTSDEWMNCFNIIKYKYYSAIELITCYYIYLDIPIWMQSAKK